MFTLAIDTSTDTISVALLEDREVLGEIYLNNGLHHAGRILPMIDYLCRTTGTLPGDADLLACTIGPGSFTGLRVGVSTIKGLALAMKKPVVGVSTLDALALNITDDEKDICPLMDARNGNVYSALYRCRQSVMPEKIVADSLVPVEEVLQGIANKTVFLGSGAKKYASLITAKLQTRGRIAPDHQHSVRAAVVGCLGVMRFMSGDCTDVRTLAPRYLQPSAAEKLGSPP